MGRFALIFGILIMLLAALPAATAGFTYQGKLTDSAGVPLTGTYNLSFKLYDAPTAGTQVGTTVSQTGVSVAVGFFTVTLDFGATAFSTGADRWLETTVGTAILSPRLQLGAVPSAVFAQTVPWSGVIGLPTSWPPSGEAGGDLTGEYPGPTVAPSAITSDKLASDTGSIARVTGGLMRASNGGLLVGLSSDSAPTGWNPPIFGLYQYGMTPDQMQGNGQDRVTGIQVWQSFTPSVSGRLVGVVLDVYSDGPWTKTLSIYVDTGAGGGGALTSQVITGTGLGSSEHIYLLDNPIPLAANAPYTLELNGGVQEISVAADTTNPYAGGRASGSATTDLVFATFMGSDLPQPALVVSRPSGNVGIGTSSPNELLDVAGRVKMEAFYLPVGYSSGWVLTSNANGDGTWQPLPAGPTTLPPSGAAGGDLTGTYPNPTIGINKIDSSKIIDGGILNQDLGAGSVSSTKIADGGVNLVDMANDSVDGTKIVDGSISVNDLGASSVDSTKIADSSVALADLAANSVNSTKIVDGSVASGDLSSDAASLSKVTGGAANVSAGNLGIGVTPTTKLDVAGTAKMTGFQLGTAATAGQVLTSNASGVGTWQTLPSLPTTLPPSGPAGGDLTGTYPNPELATSAASLLKVSGGAMASVGGKIGIGTASPAAPLHVAGGTTVDQSNPWNNNGYASGTYSGVWQSFTAGKTGALVGLSCIVACDTTALFNIYDGEGQAGRLVYSSKVSLGSVINMKTLSLNGSIWVTAGSKYTFYFGGGPLVSYDVSCADSYTSGTSSIASRDTYFTTIMANDSVTADGTVSVAALRVGTAATVGQVLTADPYGWGSWQPLPSTLPPTGAAGGSLSGTYPNPTIAAGAVTTAEIADGTIALADMAASSVDSSKILDGSVALIDLASGSVNSSKIVDASIALADMGSGSVDSSKIVDASVALGDMAANSVDSTKIVDGSVALADHAANSVDASKIVDGSVASADLASDAASLAKVSAGLMTVSGTNVGVGTTTPIYDFQVNGTVGFIGLAQLDRRNLQWDLATGQLSYGVSSRRYKDNIVPLKADFAKFMQLEPKTYTYKSSPDVHEIGYIAEDVYDLGLKDLVQYDLQGRPDGLKYEKMVLYLNEIVKTQQQQIEDQQRQIDELKKLATEAIKGK